MPDPVERDRHREIVRERLEAPVIAETPADQAETAQLTGGAPED